MTAEEIETIRQFNVAFTKAGLDRALHARVMGLGASRYLAWEAAEPGQRPLRLPPWATDQVAAISSEVVAGLRASGARVVGDLGLLDQVTADDVGDGDVPACVPAEIGGRLAVGVVVATGRGRSVPYTGGESDDEVLAKVATRHLLLTLATRARTFSMRKRTVEPATPSGRVLTPGEAMALTAFRDELARTGLVGPAYDALAAGVGRFIAEEPAADDAPASDGLVPVGAAAGISLATVRALGLDRRTRLGRFLRPPIAEPIEVARMPTRRVIGELGRRAVRR
jgi:hypothetical protein